MPMEVKTHICEYINSSPLNAVLTDAEIISILNKYGLTVHSPILYIADLGYRNNSVSVTQTGSLSVYGRLGLDGIPVALYSYTNNIESY